MSKFLLLALVLTFCLGGCFRYCDEKNLKAEEVNPYKEVRSFNRDGYNFTILEYEGHRYIVADNGTNYGGGISIVHLESCECKKGVDNANTRKD